MKTRCFIYGPVCISALDQIIVEFHQFILPVVHLGLGEKTFFFVQLSQDQYTLPFLRLENFHKLGFTESVRQPQKKGISPCTQKIEIKDVKGVFCANQCLFAHMFQMSPMLPQVWL